MTEENKEPMSEIFNSQDVKVLLETQTLKETVYCCVNCGWIGKQSMKDQVKQEFGYKDVCPDCNHEDFYFKELDFSIPEMCLSGLLSSPLQRELEAVKVKVKYHAYWHGLYETGHKGKKDYSENLLTQLNQAKQESEDLRSQLQAAQEEKERAEKWLLDLGYVSTRNVAQTYANQATIKYKECEPDSLEYWRWLRLANILYFIADACRDYGRAQEICQKHKLGRGGENTVKVLIESFEAQEQTIKQLTEAHKREKDSRDRTEKLRETAFRQLGELYSKLLPPRPKCRDCADSDGRCGMGYPCDQHEHALEVVSTLQQEAAKEKWISVDAKAKYFVCAPGKEYLLLFENGEIRGSWEEDQPIEMITHAFQVPEPPKEVSTTNTTDNNG